MTTRSKCDVIPVWMFRELDAGAKETKHKAKTQLQEQQKQEEKKIKKEIEDAITKAFENEKIGRHFIIESTNYHPYVRFELKKSTRNDIEAKANQLFKGIEAKYNKKLQAIDDKYEQWKMEILTGKIPRSRVKGFEL